MAITPQIAKYVFDHTVGCRYGTDTRGAAYGFLDIDGGGSSSGSTMPDSRTLLAWLKNPSGRWDDRLLNTCGVIVSLAPAGTVLVVSDAAPTAERYLFGAPCALGDGYSFRKANRLSPSARILGTVTYNASNSPVTNDGERCALAAQLRGDMMNELARLAGAV